MTDRVFGFAFLLFGSIGYLCIAEDLRYFHEIIGVSAVFIAGAVLTASGFHWLWMRPVIARSVAAGLVLGIPTGLLMQDIPNGVAVGLAIGVVAGVVIDRHRRRTSPADPPTASPGPRA